MAIESVLYGEGKKFVAGKGRSTWRSRLQLVNVSDVKFDLWCKTAQPPGLDQEKGSSHPYIRTQAKLYYYRRLDCTIPN